MEKRTIYSGGWCSTTHGLRSASPRRLGVCIFRCRPEFPGNRRLARKSRSSGWTSTSWRARFVDRRANVDHGRHPCLSREHALPTFGRAPTRVAVEAGPAAPRTGAVLRQYDRGPAFPKDLASGRGNIDSPVVLRPGGHARPAPARILP